ncbi:polysaccharide deacetylase [Hahella sp. CCB-MM4]|uniref:XrtA system polysaccharide deacetylase n=1 Tax=Hahella sp. (strain CCB-MM4) TaxID=1926491 RepID=UPI000B9C2EB3|nr:XrtA system polysaccharide deacetylase [Hahella sp. CCB-MM4]OZG73439.1 polysaccharide deacetylase [Hahella sp. CCB-MM4]
MKSEVNNITHAMTVDVEDYFQVSAFENIIDREKWDALPHRVEKNTRRLLKLFDDYGYKATFFTLGWVAERNPSLIRDIVENGHELASHGYGHMRATEQSREEFRQDVERSKKMLEDMSGQEVIGYRAPSFSINDSNRWVFDELAEMGFKYSSSTYPVKHDLYGVPHWPRFPYKLENGLTEIPMTTLKLGSRTMPMSGGGYFRLYPYFVSRFLFNKFVQDEKSPAIFYMHPWEIDPDQPRQQGISAKTAFRHYLNLSRHEKRFKRLLADFQWGRMDKAFGIVA